MNLLRFLFIVRIHSEQLTPTFYFECDILCTNIRDSCRSALYVILSAHPMCDVFYCEGKVIGSRGNVIVGGGVNPVGNVIGSLMTGY